MDFRNQLSALYPDTQLDSVIAKLKALSRLIYHDVLIMARSLLLISLFYCFKKKRTNR